ncbi:MAG: thymidine phosphorylase [Spirochaetaceae bacterium]|nr:thymidine phosphorylase [Spirochaetaceae bacterium]
MTDIIMKKRAGEAHSPEEIKFLIQGYVSGEIPEYQISAWLMAVYFQSMSFTEAGYLTRSMIDSGKVFHLKGLKGPLVDKHSTGGVGDKLSLILAPIAASCGLQIPMMSGRALGHTGGTLDKLDSINGYSTALSEKDFQEIIKKCGFAMTGQSKDVVPADRLMYALRDVTATVESIPLITASIMSKKFAEGAQSLIFDVKCGSGAFMKTQDDARALAESLVETGRSLGRKVVAVITDMNEPLGKMVGNFLEVEESILALQGQGPEDVMEVTYRLTAWMLVAGGICTTVEEAETLCRKKIHSGEALQAFLENVKLQGGDPEELLAQVGKRRSKYSRDILSGRTGIIQSIDSFAVGLAGVTLGVGRNKTEDPVEPLAGIEFHKKTGDRVNKSERLCTLYGEDPDLLKEAARVVENSMVIEESSTIKKNKPASLILEEITAL